MTDTPDQVDAVDEILENYRAWLLGKNDREKTWLIKADAKAKLNALLVEARIKELRACLQNVPMPSLSYEQIEARLEELEKLKEEEA